MTEQQSSYRQIFKATSLFGGVQVFQIIISIIRSKFVAVLLGPAGMGINGLLNSTTGMIASLTNFGLGTSAIKNVAAANATGDTKRIGTVVGVMRKLVWITGALGALITLVFSPWLSELTFGNRDYTLAFVWISVTLLLNQISTGQGVVLRGMRQLKYMAQASLSGAVLGLIVSVPIYYKWGIDGIVPAIIVSSVVSLLRTWYFSRKVKIEKVETNKETILKEGKGMLTMGFMLSLSGMITLAASYIIRIYISNTGGVEQVGLFAAGFAIINNYVGMIFTAMSTDYYPRLSAVNEDISQIKKVVTQQAEIAILILSPIIVSFLIFSPVVIRILYSNQFLPIVSMINWAIIGMFFKAASWAMGFILYAKGDSSMFIKTAFGFNVIFLINNIAGYYILGLTGLGVSFLLNYVIHFSGLLIITRKRYSFKFEKGFYNLFIIGLCFCFAGFFASFFEIPFIKYLMGIVVLAGTTIYAYKNLENKLNLKDFLNQFLKKFKK